MNTPVPGNPDIARPQKRRRLYEPLPDIPSAPPLQPTPAQTTMSATSAPQEDSKATTAHHLILDHVVWASSIALVPLPLIDLVGLSAIKLAMIKKLSALYGVTFSRERVRALIMSLTASLQVKLLVSSLGALVPGLGVSVLLLSRSVMSGALVYAVGKVFVMHFESGGTLLDFDPGKVRAYFAEQYQAGQRVVAENAPASTPHQPSPEEAG